MKEQKKKIQIIILLIIIIIVGGLYFIKGNVIKGKKVSTVVPNIKVIENKTNESSLSNYIGNVGNLKYSEAYRLLIKTGKYKEAIEKLEGIYKDSKKSGTSIEKKGNGILLVSAYLGYANSYYKEEEYSEKARKLLNELGINDKEWLKNFYMGYSYEIIKQYKKALESYNKIIFDYKGNNKILSIAYNQIGHTYDLEGDISKAYEYYKKALNLDKTNLKASINIARYFARNNKIPEAISLFKTVLVKIKSDTEKSEIWYTLSSLTLSMGDKNSINDAFEYANSSIKLNEDNSNGYMIRGKVLLYAGKDNFEEAINSFNTAIELYKYNYYAYEGLGLIEMELGNNKKALEYFTKSYNVIDKDISLMDNMRAVNKGRILFYKSLVNSLLGNKKDAIDNILNLRTKADIYTLLLLNAEVKKKNYGRYFNIKDEKVFLGLINSNKNK